MCSLVYEYDIALIGGTDNMYENPLTFENAWDHLNEKERTSWRDAIQKEFRDMINRKVWIRTEKANVRKDRRLIGSKWVFKRKRNGVYCARLVALGYAQVPGVDHKDNFAQMVTEIRFQSVLIMGLTYRWVFEIVDIEAAFLYGKFMQEQWSSASILTIHFVPVT